MTFEEIFAVDRSNMFALLKKFPQQVREAVAIGNAARIPPAWRKAQHIVLCGLGGSAIGGDLLRTLLAGELKVPFLVQRNYTLPRFAGRSTLVIISSYSGATEETLAAHREAVRRRAPILCISSGGAVERTARARRTPLITIPGGLPPRAALGYSFFPLLIALQKAGLARDRRREISETISLLEEKAAEYAVPDPAANRALTLALLLRNRLGAVYSAAEPLEAVNLRWRGQLAENAKTLALGAVLPEMNHNELVGWKVLREQMAHMPVVFLRDRGEHRRVARRIELTRGILEGAAERVEEVWSEGRSGLARMFSLVCLGDWVSYYLSILHGEDPTPVEVIDRLKSELARS
ncbi:MAG: bifunctional phosphoglucose/phosphomannose isomerase [Bacteroidota bacterium]